MRICDEPDSAKGKDTQSTGFTITRLHPFLIYHGQPDWQKALLLCVTSVAQYHTSVVCCVGPFVQWNNYWSEWSQSAMCSVYNKYNGSLRHSHYTNYQKCSFFDLFIMECFIFTTCTQCYKIQWYVWLWCNWICNWINLTNEAINGPICTFLIN